MYFLDIDGTLLPYDGYKGFCGKANQKLIDSLRREGVTKVGVATNQGGIPMGELGWKRDSELVYPTVSLFLQRLDYLATELRFNGIYLTAVRVSLYHPRTVGLPVVESAADRIRETAWLAINQIPDWKVFTEEKYRKPAPGMLLDAGATVFYGDSPEDEQAAMAAGIPFIGVTRFM